MEKTALIARAAALGLALALLAGLVWVMREHAPPELTDLLTTGESRELSPALFQSAPLRSQGGGADRVYLLSTQQEKHTVLRRRRLEEHNYLHVDLWAIDPANARVAWKQRLRTFEGEDRRVDLRGIDLLGAHGGTLWLTMGGPLAVSLEDGRVLADGARIDAANRHLPGARVDALGYIAFGRNGLQLTLDDGSQWRIDAADLSAAPRDTPVRDPAGVHGPAYDSSGTSSRFMARALPIGERWLGMLTDAEAEHLRNRPTVPGRKPGEREGVMQEFLEANHVPSPYLDPRPEPYRLWGARVIQVSAAPKGWSEHLPDNWGKRPQFSDYAVLPEAPRFLRGGLLRESDDDDAVPLWYRDPDSVLVLHSDRLGPAGRLQLARVSGPAGKVVWTAPLRIDALRAVMRSEHDLALLGTVPPPVDAPDTDVPHLQLVRLDVASGRTAMLDLTAESLRQDTTANTAN